MKAFIIGGAGFVGKYLLNHLRNDREWEVGVSDLELDILNREAIEKLLQSVKPDYIFHLAAQSSVALSWQNPALTIDVNIKGAANVLEAVRALDYKPRVLLIGSGEEYGRVPEDEIPISENTRVKPENIYAVTKACQNMLGTLYAEAYDMDVMMVRAFNHIGPGQSPQFVVSDFCKQVAEIEAGRREPVMRVGNLSAKRDFTDVRDVVRAYGLLIEKGQKGETYNIGRGKAYEISEILEEILALSKMKITVETDKQKFRPVDVPIIEADIAKVSACTGWKPEIELKNTLAETLEYWRNTPELIS